MLKKEEASEHWVVEGDGIEVAIETKQYSEKTIQMLLNKFNQQLSTYGKSEERSYSGTSLQSS